MKNWLVSAKVANESDISPSIGASAEVHNISKEFDWEQSAHCACVHLAMFDMGANDLAFRPTSGVQ